MAQNTGKGGAESVGARPTGDFSQNAMTMAPNFNRETGQIYGGQNMIPGLFGGGQFGNQAGAQGAPAPGGQGGAGPGGFFGGYDQGWQPNPNQDYGSNQLVNQDLSREFNYSGDFGEGQWGEWAAANLDPGQQRRAQMIEQAGGSGSLGNRAITGLTGAQDWLQQWGEFDPGTLAGTDLTPYQSPYQQDVIDRSMGEMQRQHEIQGNRLDAGAQGAGAFGGDRHGIAMAEQNRNFAGQQQDWLATFNQNNYNQSMARAQQDIGNKFNLKGMNMGGAGQMGNLANMGFGWNQALQQQMGQAGGQQQQIMQNIINAQKQQQGGIQGWPQQQTGWMAGQQPALPGVGQTQSNSPGAMDYASMALQAYALYAMCWVAREVYGETNPKWLEFRTWMMSKAPIWLGRLYARHGERAAKVVKRLPFLKRALRPVMDLAIA